MERYSVDDLKAICERFWDPSQPYSAESYKLYVQAKTDLVRGGVESRDWARLLLQHPDYEARAIGAYLLGVLAERGFLGEERDVIAAELAALARRPCTDDSKEMEASDAATEALAKLGHHRKGVRKGPSPGTDHPKPALLFGDAYAPIGSSFGFLSAPIGLVTNESKSWFEEIKHRYAIRLLNEPFPEVLRCLQPAGGQPFKRLWVPTSSRRWQTAYFDNSFSGGDPFSPISYLAQRLQCDGLIVGAANDFNRLELYCPKPTEWLNLVWAVSCTREDRRWNWQRTGAEQPFEEASEYTKRPVKLRLTREMLLRYCSALEVPLDPSRFQPHALLEITG